MYRLYKYKTAHALVFGLAALTASSESSANTLGLSFKGEFLGHDSSEKQNDSDETTSHAQGFKIQWARLDYRSEASKETEYRLRLRFDKTGKKMANGQSEMIDLAYASHSFSDAIRLTFGRQKTFNAGAYGAYYFAHEGFYLKNDLYTLMTRHSGATLTLRPDDKQSLTLSVSNTLVAEVGEKQGTQTESKTPMVGLVYKGSFGVIKPFFSYYSSPIGETVVTDEDGSKKVFEGGVAETFTSVGTALSSDSILASIDLILATKPGRKLEGAEKADDDTEYQSVNLLGGYKIGVLKPILALENTKQKKGDVTATKSAAAFTLEIHPDNQLEGLSYYTGIRQATRVNEAKVGETTVELTQRENTVYFGVALNAAAKI